MSKIIKDGLIFGGTPKEVVTAWSPSENGVEVEIPIMGNIDISSIGNGTVTGAIDTLNDKIDILNNNVYCNVYYAGSGDTSTTTNIKFNTIRANDGNCYSTSTGYFTAPVDGYYLACFGYYSNTPTDTKARPAIWIVGGEMAMGNTQATCSISHIFKLNAGQQLAAGAYNSSFPLSFYASSGHNYFSVCLLHRI